MNEQNIYLCCIIYMHVYTIFLYIFVVHVNMSQIYFFVILGCKSYTVDAEELIERCLTL